MRRSKSRGKLIATVFFSFVISALGSSLHLSDFSAQRYMQNVEFLSSETMQGRGNGTPELELAADYIESQFRTDGLSPVREGGSYSQEFDVILGSEAGPGNTLEIDGIAQKEGKDFVTKAFSSSGTYTGGVVFAGYGITLTTAAWDDYEGLDVQGKAVVVLRHSPRESIEESDFPVFPTLSSLMSKVDNARRHGARAILFVTDPLNHSKEQDRIDVGTREFDQSDVDILAMHVTREAVAPLFQAAGTSLSVAQVAIDIDQAPHSFEFPGSAIRIETDVRPLGKTLRNVMAAVPGSDSKLRNEWIVIGAHYDHLGLGSTEFSDPEDIGNIHFGADDNASGTAGVLELARLVMRNRKAFKRSVLFVAFAAEEMGMLGSTYFVDNPPIPLSSIKAMINLDMIGRAGIGPLYIEEAASSPHFERWAREANHDARMDLHFLGRSDGGSDHLPFLDVGIPAVSLFTGLHPDYHSSADTVDKIDSKGALRVLSVAAGIAERVANTREEPPRGLR